MSSPASTVSTSSASPFVEAFGYIIPEENCIIEGDNEFEKGKHLHVLIFSLDIELYKTDKGIRWIERLKPTFKKMFGTPPAHETIKRIQISEKIAKQLDAFLTQIEEAESKIAKMKQEMLTLAQELKFD